MVTKKKTTTNETAATAETQEKKPRATRRKKTETTAAANDAATTDATTTNGGTVTDDVASKKTTKATRKPRSPRRKKEELPVAEAQQEVAEAQQEVAETAEQPTTEMPKAVATPVETEMDAVAETQEKTEIQEEPKQEVKQEPKQEVKQEPKQEVKQEVKQEPKQEVKQEPKAPKQEQKPLPPCPTLLIRNIIELINAPQRQLLLGDQQIQQLTQEEISKRFRWIEGTLALVLNYDIVISDTNIWLELLTGHTSSHSDPRFNCRLQFERQLEFISKLVSYRRGRFMMMSETYEEIDRFATAMDPQSHKDADLSDEAVCRNISGRLAKRLILSQQRENRLRIEGIGAESHHSAFADPAIIRRCVELFAIGKKVLLLTNDASVAIRAMGMCDDLQRTNGIDDETWDEVYAPLRPMVMTFDDLKVLDAYTRQYHFLQMAAGKQWMEDVPQRMEKHSVEQLSLWEEGFRPGDRYSEKKMQQMNGNGQNSNSGKQKQSNQKQQKQEQQKPQQKQEQQKPQQKQEQQKPQQKQQEQQQEQQQKQQEQPKQEPKQPQQKQEQQQEVVQQEAVQQEVENQPFKPSLISPEEASINENEKKQEQRRRNSRRGGGNRRTKSQNNAKAEGAATAQSSATPAPAPAPTSTE